MVTVVNGGFETGDLTGWTTTSGNATAVASAGGVVPRTGSFFLGPTVNGTSGIIYQDIPVDAVDHTAIDAGNKKAVVTYYQASFSSSDTGYAQLQALDASLNVIQSAHDQEATSIVPSKTWAERAGYLLLPENTRFIRLTLHQVRKQGSNADAYYDDISILVEDVNAPDGVQNGDAETGDMTGWFLESGNPNTNPTIGNHIAAIASGGNNLPYAGQYFFFLNNRGETTSQMSQVLNLTAAQKTSIQTSNVLTLSWVQNSFDGSDDTRGYIYVYNDKNVLLGSASTVFSSTLDWSLKSTSVTGVTTAHRCVIVLKGNKNSGLEVNSYVDRIKISTTSNVNVYKQNSDVVVKSFNGLATSKMHANIVSTVFFGSSLVKMHSNVVVKIFNGTAVVKHHFDVVVSPEINRSEVTSSQGYAVLQSPGTPSSKSTDAEGYYVLGPFQSASSIETAQGYVLYDVFLPAKVVHSQGYVVLADPFFRLEKEHIDVLFHQVPNQHLSKQHTETVLSSTSKSAANKMHFDVVLDPGPRFFSFMYHTQGYVLGSVNPATDFLLSKIYDAEAYAVIKENPADRVRVASSYHLLQFPLSSRINVSTGYTILTPPVERDKIYDSEGYALLRNDGTSRSYFASGYSVMTVLPQTKVIDAEGYYIVGPEQPSRAHKAQGYAVIAPVPVPPLPDDVGVTDVEGYYVFHQIGSKAISTTGYFIGYDVPPFYLKNYQTCAYVVYGPPPEVLGAKIRTRTN